ncbi:YitT family protein [Enterococcus nangangensis]|uniref:YitT family protein n=1 Tax=Enterococcus nangangensis TaxID=2559926 RepID=UPI0010F94132|nr:YitT family protein [Enterococcus nangangensis]
MTALWEHLHLDKYSSRLSASVVYALLASIAFNFFYLPGNIYSSGVNGVAQILTSFSESLFGIHVPMSVTLFALNIPLFVLAWLKLGKRFTIFTFITITLTSFFIQIVPQTQLTADPIICAIFGGALMGIGIGYTLKNGLSSGGLDIISLTIRKKTGKSVGSISIMFNVVIVFLAGYLFGWQYMFYSALSIFVSGKMTDVIYTKQKKMQVMIVTKEPHLVIEAIQGRMRRGITIIHDAEGAFNEEPQSILFTVVTRYEMPLLIAAMKESDPKAFVSISDNVRILGHFYEEEMF